MLPLVLADLGGSEAQAGLIRAIVGVGSVLGFALAAQGDRIGRRRLLLITIVGYTIGTVLTTASPNLAWLTVAQFLAQIFVAGEWAVAVTIVVEEFPVSERGRALGIVTSMNTIGGITVGILAFAGLQHTPLDWRGFFVVGIVPLVVVAFARRRMRETARYAAVRRDPALAHLDHTRLLEPWHPSTAGTCWRSVSCTSSGSRPWRRVRSGGRTTRSRRPACRCRAPACISASPASWALPGSSSPAV